MDYNHSSSTNGSSYGDLELCLKDILYLIKPLEVDRVKRLNLINELGTLVRSVQSLKGAVINPFGSFASNLYTRWGDLDISVELSHGLHISTNRKRKQNSLRDIMRALRRTGFARNFQFIPNARVPLLIFESNYHKISCDVSIDNHMGHLKSKILFWITNIDERFRDMVLLTKEWAKAQNINDPKLGTLNSFSLCLLVIFHFQTCNPAILPPLEEIYGGNIGDDITGMKFVTEKHIEDVCAANIKRFKSQSFSRRNESSLSQLLISFYDKFSRIGTLASEYAICTYTGRWERITSKPRWMEKSYSLLIEDPFEQSENAARAVGLKELSMISNTFKDACQKFSSPAVLKDRNYMLVNLVRYSIYSQLGVRKENHYIANGGPENHRQTEFIHRTPPSEPIGRITDKQIPLPEYVDHVTHKPIHEQFQNALRLDRHHASSSSTVTSRGKEALNMQSHPVWRPRYTSQADDGCL